MKKKLLLFASLLLLSAGLFAQDPNFHIYLCFGQSNMEGQGTIQSQDYDVDPRFKVLQSLDCSNLGRSDSTWYTAVPPTCQCWSRLSPADYFGRTMVANLPDSITVGIINVAVGGCDIRLFDKDIYEDYDSTYTESWFQDKIRDYGGNPYAHLINLANLAQQDGVIKGILLHQGETNTGDEQWPAYVKKIYNDMLTDLALGADTVPILAGEVVHADQGGVCASMNAIIGRLPDTIPTAYVISSSQCPDQTDNIHFNSEGYRKLGRRYAVQMLDMMGYEAAYGEAECASVGSEYYTWEAGDASNKGYVTAVPGTEYLSAAPTSEAGIVEITLTVNSDTTYYLYGRFNNPDSESDAWWVKVDDGDFFLLDDLTTDGWEWLELTSIELSAGEHTVQIAFSEDGGLLDKVVLKNTPISPVDIGEEASNECTPEFSPDGLQSAALNGYNLGQNYPNPFSGATNIPFSIPSAGFVSLKVYDAQGAEITELAGREFNSGTHTVIFDPEALATGNYFYTLRADNYFTTRSMLIRMD